MKRKNTIHTWHVRASRSLLCFVLMLGIACKKQGTPNEGNTAAEGIRTLITRVEEREVTPNVHSFGNLSVEKVVKVTTSVEGVVQNIYAREAQRVFKNQILMRLKDVQLEIAKKKALTNVASARADLALKKMEYEDSKLKMESKFLTLTQKQQQINQIKLELDNLKRKLEQQQKLFELNGVSKEDMIALGLQIQKQTTTYNNALLSYDIERIGFRNADLIKNKIPVPQNEEEKKQALILLNTRTVKAQVTLAEARLEVAQANLDSTELLITEMTIRAPITGTILSRDKETGERTKKDDVLFTIIDESDIEVVFSIPDTDYRLIQRDNAIEVFVPSTGNTYAAAFRIISPVVDPKSGNIVIKATIPRHPKELKHGMYAEVDIITGKKYTALFIPTTSLLSRNEERARVYKVINNRLVTQEIVLGKEEGELVEVKKGLEKTSVIVYKILPSLKEGVKIAGIFRE